ncbi:hypothetical protein LCGC14_2832050 [marine sediment metagenome]|uniref:16S rRNA (Cytosine(1402)-N(4))-methyltransferase n=1 Tax=marine sediment metagenome TaxID=412755 RepID=A0A0F9AM71_9ZZZZ
MNHLETSERGFSFMIDGPLDMRYDPAQTLTARVIVNTWAVEELAALFREHGEGRGASRIARAIGQAHERYSPWSDARPASVRRER